MIHIQAFGAIRDPISGNEEPRIMFHVIGKPDLLKLQELLNRSLNCAPEFGRDWFELSDKLEAFLKQI